MGKYPSSSEAMGVYPSPDEFGAIYFKAHAERWAEARETLVKFTESEIERLLAGYLIYAPDIRFGTPHIVHPGADFPDQHGYFIAPQFRIESYRADFALMIRSGGFEARLVVECDGHDFHDRTPEQASRDRARDRSLMAAGWPVIRFTGTDIVRAAPSCSMEASDLLHTLWSEKVWPTGSPGVGSEA